MDWSLLETSKYMDSISESESEEKKDAMESGLVTPADTYVHGQYVRVGVRGRERGHGEWAGHSGDTQVPGSEFELKVYKKQLQEISIFKETCKFLERSNKKVLRTRPFS